MKAWRRDAAAVKRHAVKTGKHLTGQRYGKALRDGRTQVIVGDAPALFHALMHRFGVEWLERIKAKLAAEFGTVEVGQ